MTCTAEIVTTQNLVEWFGAHVEFVDEGCWGPPPDAVARIVRRLVDLVGQAHDAGQSLPGLGPDAVLIGPADAVSLAVPSRPGSAVERAEDLRALGLALCVLVTGVAPEVAGAAADLLTWHAVGNPSAAALAPLVVALLDPDPVRRPDAAGLRMLLTGRAPRTGIARIRLAG
jgi:hypothetical protein